MEHIEVDLNHVDDWEALLQFRHLRSVRMGFDVPIAFREGQAFLNKMDAELSLKVVENDDTGVSHKLVRAKFQGPIEVQRVLGKAYVYYTLEGEVLCPKHTNLLVDLFGSNVALGRFWHVFHSSVDSHVRSLAVEVPFFRRCCNLTLEFPFRYVWGSSEEDTALEFLEKLTSAGIPGSGELVIWVWPHHLGVGGIEITRNSYLGEDVTLNQLIEWIDEEGQRNEGVIVYNTGPK